MQFFPAACLLASAATAAVPANPAATVNAESVAVYSESSASSVVLKQLAKGVTLIVDYSIVTSEGEWCSLGAPERGYVLCSALKREEPPKPEASSAPLPAILTPSAAHPSSMRPDTNAARRPAEPVISTPEQAALLSAAKLGSPAAIQLALSKGAIVNGPDKDGKTALMWAAYMGRNDAVRELIESGADVNAADNAGWTAVEAAVWARHAAALQLLLEQAPDVNTRDNEGRTPLMHAAQYGDLTMIRDLLAKGADPNARNRFNQTPLMFAVTLPDADAAQMLMAAGADVNARDAAGHSVLTNAVLGGAEHLANVQALLRARADINSKDNDDRTALSWALKNGHNAIAQFLKKAGAAEY